MKITAIIPAYNESDNLIDAISSIKQLVDEVIVVDDCSRDNSAQLAEAQDVIVLKHLLNRGQGAALRTGTNFALADNADIIVHFDADNQFQANDLPKFLNLLKNNQADIVFGSRFLDHSTQMPWLKKYWLMPLARLVNKLFFNIKLTDPQSGFRAFTADAAGKLTWTQDRMAHCTEIIHEAHRVGLRVREVPITVVYHRAGQGLSGGVKIIKEFLIGKLIN